MGEDIANPKDPDILEARWFTLEQILAMDKHQLRSALVLRCIEDFMAGKRIPLETLHFCGDEPAMGINCSQLLQNRIATN